MNRLLCSAIMVGGLLVSFQAEGQAPASATHERGAGPYVLELARGKATVRLLRRDRETVWVERQMSSGGSVEAGVAAADIVRIEVPRPPAFDLAEQATNAALTAQAQGALKQVIDRLRPFRDLPGIPVDEALLWQGRLLERREQWQAALALYDDILRQPYRSGVAETVELRKALMHARLQQHAQVLAALESRTLPDDDQELLSELHLARGAAYAANGEHEKAVLDIVRLIVFEPYVSNNEPRCLLAVLPSYAAMGDWDAYWKSLAFLREHYAGSAEARAAEAHAAQFETELASEARFQPAEPGDAASGTSE